MRMNSKLRLYAHQVRAWCGGRARKVRVGRGDLLLVSVALEGSAARIEELETVIRVLQPGLLGDLDASRRSAMGDPPMDDVRIRRILAPL
jgi:hypothetical protein